MKVMITGVTGTLGTAVSKRLLEKGYAVVGYSRDECKQATFPKHPSLTLYLGDVRDEKRVIEASRGVDAIYHFAALKHVDKLEENPEEAIETNIRGTQNILHAQRVNKISRVTLASTDKAAYPVNTYGMSKGIAERLVLRNPNNIVCRYGNVLASRGSVVEKFAASLKKSQMVEITDPNMTRFWITIEEAAEFIIQNSLSKGGGLRTPVMKSAPISQLADVVARTMDVKSYAIKECGVRAGEKTHECLRTEYEGEEIHSNRVGQFQDHELTAMLEPILKAIV